MSSRCRTLTIPALLVAGALIGCSATEPRQLDAEFTLDAVAGDPIPAVVIDNEFISVSVIADTIRLFRDGTGERAIVTDVTEGAAITVDRRDRELTKLIYSLRDGHFEAEFFCPADALCAPPPHLVGTLQGTSLNLTLGTGWRAPLTYTRVEE